MRITRIAIDGFGLFDDRLEIELPGDIALIIGDNETGKSTILSAVGAILFGLAGNEKARFAPHGHPSPRSGSLEIDIEAGRLRLTRDFASNHVRVEMLAPTERVLFDGSAKPSGRSDEKEAYDAVMRDLFGIESRDVFDNSVMTGQGSLEPDMTSVIRRIVSGSASADYAVALDNLKEAGEELSKEMPWRPRPGRNDRKIELVGNDIRDKKRALSDARGLAGAAEESRAKKASLETELAEIEDGIRERNIRLEELTSFERSLEEKQHAERRLGEHREKIRRIEKLRGELENFSALIETEYPQYASLPESAEADVAGFAQLVESERDLDRRRGQAEGEAPRFGLSRFEITALAVGALVAFIGGAFFGGLLRLVAVAFGGGAVLFALVHAYLALRSRQQARQGRLDELRRQIGSLKGRIEETRETYPMLKQGDPNAILERLNEFGRLQREKGNREAALRQHEDLEKVESERDRLDNELVIADGKIEGLKSKRPSLSDIEREGRIGRAREDAKADIPRMENRRKELAAEREEVVRALAGAEAKETVSEEALEDDISEAESRLRRLKLSRDAYIMAVGVLEEAVAEFRASHLSRIEQKTTDLVERITGLRGGVRLSEKLEPLGLERDGQLLGLEQLSRGVRDQLHFALRVAAVEEISGGRHLPILLDDPFVNFDEHRLRATLKTLERLSESHQVVLLAHDLRYCDWRRPARVLER